MMNNLFDSIATHPIVVAFGWTLFHSVWQIAMVGALAGIGLQVFRLSRPAIRYSLIGACMVIIFAASVTTFCFEFSQSNVAVEETIALGESIRPNSQQESKQAPSIEPSLQEPQFRDASVDFNGEPDSMTSSTAIVSKSEKIETQRRKIAQWGLPVFCFVWLSGVFLLSVRMLCGFAAIRRWVKTAGSVDDGKIESVFRLLVDKLRVTKSIQLLASKTVLVPAIVGFFRPVVLVPTSMISGLSIKELEAILAHELAHVRRHDYIVNILQVAFETLFFHHPITWWLSNRMRIEREHCCDDIAAKSCGSRIEFAKALAKLEEIRSTKGLFSIAANGGSLVGRIQRLAGKKSNESFTWPIGIFAIFASLV